MNVLSAPRWRQVLGVPSTSAHRLTSVSGYRRTVLQREGPAPYAGPLAASGIRSQYQIGVP
jgi:hypothetical protein